MLLTTRSPIEIVPEVMFSSPASIRNKVDLPQPDGPTNTTKAPSSIGIETPCRTSKPPNDFRTSRICTDDILYSSNLLVRRDKSRGRPSCLMGVLSDFFGDVVGSKSYWGPLAANVAIGTMTCK